MMRNLSLTAAAIQKQSRSIDLDLKQSVPLQALEAKYHELYEQMQLLQEQQREFLSGGQSGSAKHKAENTHAAGSPSRRESILSQAKDKLISILKTVAGENSSSAGQRPVVMTSVQRSSFAQPAPPMPQFRQQSSFHAPRFVEPSAPALPEGVGMAARRKPVNYEAIMIADKYPQQQQQQRRSSMKKRHSVVSPVRFEEAPQQNNDYRRPSGVSRQGRRNYSNETDLTDFYQQRPTNGMRGGMVTTTDVPPHRRNTFLDIHHHQQQQSYPADNVKLKQKQGMPQTSQEAIEQITRYCASMRQGSVHGGVEQLIP
jgi:hypothetical protein